MRRLPWRRNAAIAPGRGELRRMFEQWSPDDLFALHRRRVQRYLSIWFAVYGPLAEQAGLTEQKQQLHRQRMAELLERCDAVRAGETVVKARLTETDSAISAVTTRTRYQPTRTAALTARTHLQLASGGYTPSQYPSVVAAAVYDWAEIETRFPGDAAALLQSMSPDERATPAGGKPGDSYHLLYGAAAEAAGLGAEGRAVVTAAGEIVETLNEPLGPPDVEVEMWLGSTDIAAEQRAAGYREFHGREPPPWMT